MRDIFQPAINCHRLSTAHRAAPIVDGEDYFRALYESFSRARREIFVIGWDFHSGLQLVRDDLERRYPARLGALLDRLVSEKKDLHVYLLSWDFSMIYAMERELFPRYRLKWRTRRRIHFCLDGHHPMGASQHQKVVVVDDAVAFAGGLDLSQWRWDTSAHHPEDPRRVDPGGNSYPPFHDVQMVVDGPAARALGELAKDRWARAGGKKPRSSAAGGIGDPWPPSIDAEFDNVRVAMARTLPEYKDRKAVREAEQLYMDSIAAARRSIYIENQYLSSHSIGQALKQRLKEADGPEVVIVLPHKTGGWLEQHTMDVLRGRILTAIRQADKYDRLRVYYPRIAEDPGCDLMVHSKVMVIDDDFLRIGSSNLNNRSMGLDSECDLAISAEAANAVRQAIARFRNRLIAEHVQAARDDIDAAIEKTGSLIKAIESLPKGARRLVQLSGEVPPDVDRWVPESALLDPEKPVEPDELFDYVVAPDHQPNAYRQLMKILLLIAGVLILAAAWRWTPAGAWLNVETALAAGEWIRRQPLSPVLVPVTYIIGGMVAFPITLIIIATVLVFGPWWGLFYALTGSTLSAVVVFGTGRALGRQAVNRVAGSLLNRLSRKLSESGLIAVITFRVIPVAPFSVINLIAGVSGIRLRDFAIGTFVGLLPGVLAIVFLADRISESLRRPDLGNIAALAGGIVLTGAGLVGLGRWIKRKHAERKSGGEK